MSTQAYNAVQAALAEARGMSPPPPRHTRNLPPITKCKWAAHTPESIRQPRHAMNAITIHNVNGPRPTCDVNLYCGRNGSKYPWLVDAGLGNPFPMKGEAGRDAVCEEYGSFLRLSLPDSPLKLRIARIAQLVREGKTVSLSCHCHPKRCHCDTIKAAVERILQQESQP